MSRAERVIKWVFRPDRRRLLSVCRERARADACRHQASEVRCLESAYVATSQRQQRLRGELVPYPYVVYITAFTAVMAGAAELAGVRYGSAATRAEERQVATSTRTQLRVVVRIFRLQQIAKKF
eukprot:scaffold326274_cov35-Prasinocladus_malaysianus.AAC.1